VDFNLENLRVVIGRVAVSICNHNKCRWGGRKMRIDHHRRDLWAWPIRRMEIMRRSSSESCDSSAAAAAPNALEVSAIQGLAQGLA
jgi:hypothetical protein